MIKAIIFDLGGVLVDNPVEAMTAYIAQNLAVTKEQYMQVFSQCEAQWLKGQIAERELWEKITTKLNIARPEAESLWLEAFLRVYKRKKDVFLLIKRLKQNGYKIALLSNTEIPIMDHIKEQHWEDFDLFIYSCEVGMRKPDREIYDFTLQKLNMEPREVLFVDDKKENVEAARDIGMHGITFVSGPKLGLQLKKLQLLST
ncbi:MAG TPA: HAD family phosphatase [Patescibacteria group bacterium]|nr:HAD family phosphatase [Patescibacteria group bacterium]